tara:strand:+ start:232 stop:1914 length:1683 start_codon:yes stop_codon:yes gene_type:complete
LSLKIALPRISAGRWVFLVAGFMVLVLALGYHVRLTVTTAFASAAELLSLEQQNRLIWGETILAPVAIRMDRSVNFLTRLPAVAGIGRAVKNNGTDPEFDVPQAVWVERLGTIFLSYVKAQPDVFQARLIDARTGYEMVRAQRLPDGTLHQASDAELQFKGERDYFRAGLLLQPGQVMFSSLELNRELGRIEEPYRPTLRVVTPAVDTRGEVWGLIIVNLEVSSYLDRLSKLNSETFQVWLTSEVGHYLLHPQADHGFRHEIYQDVPGWQDEYELGRVPPDSWSTPGSVYRASARLAGLDDLLFSERPVDFDQGAGGPRLTLRVVTAAPVFEQMAWRLAVERLLPTAFAFIGLLAALYVGILLSQVRARNRLLLAREEELRQATEQLHELAHTDGLTGVANRRQFDEALEREWARAQRNQSAISLLLVDLDHFKAINDQLGHAEGDEVLRLLPQMVRPQLKRPVDLLARYGGEEFVVLLPDTNLEGAAQLAEHLRKAVQRGYAERAHREGEGMAVVTASFGCACTVPSVGQHSATLLHKADELLYAAKAAGRNRVHAAEV